jgi:hypothetical protein
VAAARVACAELSCCPLAWDVCVVSATKSVWRWMLQRSLSDGIDDTPTPR